MRKILFVLLISSVFSCGDDPTPVPSGVDLTDIAYNPVEYSFKIPDHFPEIEQDPANIATVDGVQLGRMLFYDPIMSKDSTMSCFSCHAMNGNFTDRLKFSTGVEGLSTPRSAMTLLNIGYHYDGLLWDGRSPNLEHLALLPIEDPIELNTFWPVVMEKLKNHDEYPSRFRKAFGIENSDEMTKELAAKAIAQFTRTIISSGSSKFDRVAAGLDVFTDDEYEGYEMFFDLNPDLPDAECGHCHSGFLFTTNEYLNNGITEAATLDDFSDKGFGMVSGNRFDNGKFKVPTLRNIEFSGPYMHDGRFESFADVLQHYNSGGKSSPNKNELIYPLGLTDAQLAKLTKFIETLRDTEVLNREEYSNPFE